MLYLFRRIRKSLISSGLAQKYILYAIGETALVVIGILIALQVNNWKESRMESERERQFLNRLQDDLEFDLETFQSDINYLETVYSSGMKVLSFLKSNKKCESNCIPILVSFYNASQWAPLTPRETTFNEISLTGFPRNRQLKDLIILYHSNFALVNQISKPSEYRQHVRSIIDPDIQKILFKSCHPTRNVRFAKVIEDCRPEISETRSREIVDKIMEEPRTQNFLRFWMGTIIGMQDAIESNINEARKMIDMIEEELSK